MINNSTTKEADLQFLTNPMFNNSLNQKNNDKEITNKIDINNYKKRIFLLTKSFLQNKKTEDTTLNNVFNNYASLCINYFKFKDVSKIIQNDYVDYKNNLSSNTLKSDSKNDIKKNVKKSNKLMMNIPTEKADIKNFIQYKKHSKKTLVIPKVKDISYN